MSENQATLSDLKDVLKDTLQARGSLDQIRARVRAEIFAALDDQSAPKPMLSNENLVINELIREYMEYNGYRHTLSVFLPESGQPIEKPFERAFLSSELNVIEDPRFVHIPLLYSIVAGLQQAKVDDDAHQQTGLDRFSTERERFTDPGLTPSPIASNDVSYRDIGNEPTQLMFKK